MLCACELVIIGENQSPTLVNLLNEMTFTGQKPPSLKEDAENAIPFKWNIFAQWEFANEELKSKWSQRLRIIKQSGEPTKLDHEAEIIPEKGRNLHRMIATLNFFPVFTAGEYRIEISIRTMEENNWNVMGSYPLTVKYA